MAFWTASLSCASFLLTATPWGADSTTSPTCSIWPFDSVAVYPMTVESAKVASYWPPITLVVMSVCRSCGMIVILSKPLATHFSDNSVA